MAFEVEGTLISRSPVSTGLSARGSWKKQECIVEYQMGRFPTKLCLSVWGDDLIGTLAAVTDGSRVKVSFDIASREFQGRWYTDLRLWKMEVVLVVSPNVNGTPEVKTPTDLPPMDIPEYEGSYDESVETEQDDDLPF